MITGRIGRHEVLFPINHKNYNFREKKNTKVWKGEIYVKSFYTVSRVIETKVVIGGFKLQLKMWLNKGWKFLKKLWCCVGGGNKVIWLYQLSWKCKLATVTCYKADVSSVSPSSERKIGWLVDLNYNFECDWLIELSDNNLTSELVENRSNHVNFARFVLFAVSEEAQTLVFFVSFTV